MSLRMRIHPRYRQIHAFFKLVFLTCEENVFNQKLRFSVSFYVAKVSGNLVFVILLFGK